MIQQAYKYVRSSSWPCKMFFKLKITKILKSGWRGLEKNELPWEPNFIGVGVLPLELLACPVSMVSAVK